MKRTILIIGVVVVMVILVLPKQTCDGNSKAANYARSLSKERIRQLYLDMEMYSRDERTPIDGWWVSLKQEVPLPFRDLKVARIRPREANIMVDGCMDEFLYLAFDGFGGQGPRTVTLSYAGGS